MAFRTEVVGIRKDVKWVFKLRTEFATLFILFFLNFARLLQVKIGLRNEFALAFQISQGISQGKTGLRNFRKVHLRLRNFHMVDMGLRNFCKVDLRLRIALFFLLPKKFEKFFHLFWNSPAIDYQKLN